MIDEMGIFRTTIGVAALADPEARADLAGVMVDTGSEYSWLPEELLAQLGVAPVRVEWISDARSSFPPGRCRRRLPPR